MSVIHPSLFLIMKHFPDREDILRRMYLKNKTFKSICEDYQKCEEALHYWSKSELAEAKKRHREYLELLDELKSEIQQSLDEGS